MMITDTLFEADAQVREYFASVADYGRRDQSAHRRSACVDERAPSHRRRAAVGDPEKEPCA